jgi:hypothetical protein
VAVFVALCCDARGLRADAASMMRHQADLRENNRNMKVQVECYSGRKADERPGRFRLEEVLDQWYGPEHVFFKTRADDGNLYILRHETSVLDRDWELVSFREVGRG